MNQTPTTVDWLPQRVLLIAEAGVNHNGDLELARELVDAAAQAGADAVKFQTFDPARLLAPGTPKAQYQRESSDPDESQNEMLGRLQLSRDRHRELFERCQTKRILFLSTAYEEESAEFLNELGVPIFKIASGEVTNLPFLRSVASKGRPLILSTGMSTLGEVEAAVDVISETGNHRLALLHCLSDYPAAPSEVNLRAMQTLESAFGLPVGFSDHTEGIEIGLAAVALGARIIEKHFTLNRQLPGPDHKASAEPPEFAALVRGVRKVEASLGDGRKRPTASEREVAAAARKSLVALRDLPAGTLLAREMIAAKRPGTGLPPSLLGLVEGRRLRTGVRAGELLTFGVLE